MKRRLEERFASRNFSKRPRKSPELSTFSSLGTSSDEESDSSLSSSDSSNSDSSDESSSDDSEGSTAPPASVKLYTEDDPPTGKLFWYWTQRYRMFSLYDEGIWMTDDSWFEVTPEQIAAEIAEKILQGGKCKVVVDAFCGVGGNAIQFALHPKCEKVYAIDTNSDAIKCAKRNARIYGVAEKIEFICGDCFQLLDMLREKQPYAVFLSPPWGGPKYRKDSVFDLEAMEPYSASSIVKAARSITNNLALYIPRTSDLTQLADLEGDGHLIEAVHYCLERRSKAITAYFGALSKHYSPLERQSMKESLATNMHSRVFPSIL